VKILEVENSSIHDIAAHLFSKSAQEKITKAGGTFEVLKD
jgi:ribosomal protein L18E